MQAQQAQQLRIKAVIDAQPKQAPQASSYDIPAGFLRDPAGSITRGLNKVIPTAPKSVDDVYSLNRLLSDEQMRMGRFMRRVNHADEHTKFMRDLGDINTEYTDVMNRANQLFQSVEGKLQSIP